MLYESGIISDKWAWHTNTPFLYNKQNVTVYSGNTSIEAVVVLTIPGACVRNEPVRHGATPLHSVGEFTKPQVKGVQCLCLTRAWEIVV